MGIVYNSTCSYFVSTIWHENFFLLIWKASWNREEWRFSFWNTFFSFQRDWNFSIMQISSVMASFGVQLKTGKILNKQYLWNYWSSALGTWYHKCASLKKQNDTLKAVTLTTVLPLVLSQKKLKFPVFVLNLHHLPQPIRWLELRQY